MSADLHDLQSHEPCDQGDGLWLPRHKHAGGRVSSRKAHRREKLFAMQQHVRAQQPAAEDRVTWREHAWEFAIGVFAWVAAIGALVLIVGFLGYEAMLRRRRGTLR